MSIWTAAEFRAKAPILCAWADERVWRRDAAELQAHVERWESEGGGLKYDPHACAVCGRRPNETEPWCSPLGSGVGYICFDCGYRAYVSFPAGGAIEVGELVVLSKDGKVRQAANAISDAIRDNARRVLKELGPRDAFGAPAPTQARCRHCGDTIEDDYGWYHVNDPPIPSHPAEPAEESP